MKSAFEGHWQGDSTRSTSSAGSWVSEDDNTRKLRVVGFPDLPASDVLGRAASCSLEERPKRQSSLAQQLALASFEQEKPKLRAINTKAPSTRRLNLLKSAGAQGMINALPANTQSASGATRARPMPSGFEFGSTLPSGDGLTKAYTAPEPLPELEPELVKLLAASGQPQSQQQPSRLGAAADKHHSPIRGHQSPLASGPGHSAEREVAALREALRQEQLEVARLRMEMAKLATQQQSNTGKLPLSARSDVQMTPVTPEAAAEQHLQEASPPSPRPFPSPFGEMSTDIGGEAWAV